MSSWAIVTSRAPALTLDPRPLPTALEGGALGLYAVGPSVVHFAHGSIWKGLVSIALRAVLPLAGCDSIRNLFNETPKARLPGERISVLALEPRFEPDPALGQVTVTLPKPFVNPDWPGAGRRVSSGDHGGV